MPRVPLLGDVGERRSLVHEELVAHRTEADLVSVPDLRRLDRLAIHEAAVAAVQVDEFEITVGSETEFGVAAAEAATIAHEQHNELVRTHTEHVEKMEAALQALDDKSRRANHGA